MAGLGGIFARGATAWTSDSGRFQWSITAANDLGVGQHEGHGKVWVCKMVGPPENPYLASGPNPVEVSVDNTLAVEAFSDAHPSYVVDPGDDCLSHDRPAQNATSTTVSAAEGTIPADPEQPPSAEEDGSGITERAVPTSVPSEQPPPAHLPPDQNSGA